MTARLDGLRRALIVCGLVVGLDQAVKQAVVAGVEPGERIDVALGVELVRVTNSGIAFGLLGDGGGALIAVIAAALTLLLGYFALNAGRDGLWLAIGLLVGGALGNVADRVRDDAVTDFIDLPLWPAFNLADVAITAGVLLLIFSQAGRGGEDGPGTASERGTPSGHAREPVS